jgi:hypothetical protein
MNEAKAIKPAEIEEQAPVEEARDKVVEEVAEDARRSPEKYLRDAEVPKGGE